MNRIFGALLFTFAGSLALAQDGKPTREQTIGYIQANYPQNIEYRVTYGARDGSIFLNSTGEITGIKFEFTGTRVNISYHFVTRFSQVSSGGIDEKTVSDETFLVTFDMKDIEALDAGARDSFGMIDYSEATEGAGPLFLGFKAANRQKLIGLAKNGVSEDVPVVWIPFGLDPVGTNHRAMHEAKETQLYKAFEHLRKLSGAQEPIKF